MSTAGSFRIRLLLFNLLVLLIFVIASLRNLKKPGLLDLLVLVLLPMVSYILLKKYEELH